MTSHSTDPRGRWRLRALVALTIGTVAALAFVVAPALASTTNSADASSRLANQLANCEDVAAVAQTHDEKAFAEHCVTLATRALAAAPTPTTPVSPAPTAPATPTGTPTSPVPTSAQPTVAPTSGVPTASTPDGWPDASTTGPTGPLTVRTGDLTISTAGAIVENLDVSGCVRITAPNVTFRNSRVSCSGAPQAAIVAKTTGGVLIENVDVSCGSAPIKGMLLEGATVRRADISGCEDGIYIDRNAVVLDSYLHDFYEQVTGDPADPYGHTDGIQVTDGGDNVTIRGNYIANLTPHATSAYIGDGPGMDRIVIDRNYVTGGGYVLRCSTSGIGNEVTDNTIKWSGYGPWTNCTRSGILRTGNVIL